MEHAYKPRIARVGWIAERDGEPACFAQAPSLRPEAVLTAAFSVPRGERALFITSHDDRAEHADGEIFTIEQARRDADIRLVWIGRWHRRLAEIDEQAVHHRAL